MAGFAERRSSPIIPPRCLDTRHRAFNHLPLHIPSGQIACLPCFKAPMHRAPVHLYLPGFQKFHWHSHVPQACHAAFDAHFAPVNLLLTMQCNVGPQDTYQVTE